MQLLLWVSSLATNVVDRMVFGSPRMRIGGINLEKYQFRGDVETGILVRTPLSHLTSEFLANKVAANRIDYQPRWPCPNKHEPEPCQVQYALQYTDISTDIRLENTEPIIEISINGAK